MRSPYVNHKTSYLMVFAASCLALGLISGCTGENTTAPLEPVENPEEALEGGMGEFNTFTESADQDPGSQLLDDPAMGELMNSLGIAVFGKVRRDFQGEFQGTITKEYVDDWRAAAAAPGLTAAVVQGAGTYQRDMQDATEPFPGWVLVEAGNPQDGYVFRFDLDDDISYTDENEVTVPVQGEFRMLEVVIFDNGTPSDPEDDFVTHMVTEIAASPDPGPAPTLARMELTATLTTKSAHLVVGNAQSSDPSDPNASFIGPVVVHAELSISETSFNAVEQLYHSLEDFGVRSEQGMTFDAQSGTPSSADFARSFGISANPASLPWRFALGLDNFRVVETMEVADVSGSITLRGAPVATLAGDTTIVPVDLDGNGVNDGYCANVNITFADNPEVSENVCEAVVGWDESFMPF